MNSDDVYVISDLVLAVVLLHVVVHLVQRLRESLHLHLPARERRLLLLGNQHMQWRGGYVLLPVASVHLGGEVLVQDLYLALQILVFRDQVVGDHRQLLHLHVQVLDLLGQLPSRSRLEENSLQLERLSSELLILTDQLPLEDLDPVLEVGVLALVLPIEDVEEIEGGVAGKMNDSLLARIVNVAEDLEIAEHGNFNGFLQQSLLPLAVGHLPVAEVWNQLDLIDAPFAHSITNSTYSLLF